MTCAKAPDICTPHGTVRIDMNAILVAYYEQQARIAAATLRAEAAEAKIDTLTRERDEARERLAHWVSWGDRMASGHPDAPMASLDHEVRAVIANRYGMSVLTAARTADAASVAPSATDVLFPGAA